MIRAIRDSGRPSTPRIDRHLHPRRSGGFTEVLITILTAAQNGMAASRRYEDLRRQGLPPDQAVSRALTETGQGA